ncbi:MAG: ErfK/YbiS/YcfS/YnhG family protein [Candidatus Solibacter sp.]|nr:ErfK/YbiS/YcfS/YnhG family protein [Candidatus Solibacter sp.]
MWRYGVMLVLAGIVLCGTVSIDPAAVNNPAQSAIVHGAKGAGVVRGQILLNRAHFSSGEIDGSFGTNLQKAVTAFQSERKLPVSGAIDAVTWEALNGDAAPALIPYTLTDEDVAGPFLPIPADVKAQAQMPALGYTSALEMLGEKFHSSPQLLQSLNPGADFSKAGQQLMAPNTVVMTPPVAGRLVVSKNESSVRAYDSGGKLLAFYSATIGSEHDPLPIGEWKIRGVARHPKFHYNPDLFWDAKTTDGKATLPAGPNNPVGMVWIDLSKEHYGIHGTPEPGKIGHTESHGCIRLTNWDALELAAMVKPGTPATFQE